MNRILSLTMLCLLLFLSVVFMVSCGKNVTDDPATMVASTGTVSGKVVTSDTGVGVGEAVISLGGRTVATSATDGSFIIAGVNPGNEQLVAQRGTDVGSTTVAITAGELTQAQITIISKGTNSVTAGNLAVIGRVVDAVTGEGVDGVSVQITDLGMSTMSRQWDSQITYLASAFPAFVPSAAKPNGPEHHGYFDFSNVPPGVHSFKFTKTGFYEKQVSFECTAAAGGAYFVINSLPIVYDSRPSGNISGYVNFEADGFLPGDTLDNDGSLDGNKREWVATLELDTGLRTITSVLDGRMGYFKFENLRPRVVKYDAGGNITDPAYQITAKASYLETNAAGVVVIRNTYQKRISQIEVDAGKTTIANLSLSQDDLISATGDLTAGPDIIAPMASNPASIVTSSSPTFYWEIHSEAASYMVTLYHIESPGADGTGGTTKEVIFQEEVTTNKIVYPATGSDLVNNNYYRLRVDVIKRTGDPISGITKMVTFQKVAPLAPTRLAPLNGDITDTSPTLAWNRGDHTGNYVLQIYTELAADNTKCDFSKVLFQAVTNDTSFTMNTDASNTFILHGRSYWWTVAQADTANNSPIEFKMVTDINDLDNDGSTSDLVLDVSKFTTDINIQPTIDTETVIDPETSYAGDGFVHIVIDDPAAYAADILHEKHFHILYLNGERQGEYYGNVINIAAPNNETASIAVSLVTETGVESRTSIFSSVPRTSPLLSTANWIVAPAALTVAAAGPAGEKTVEVSVSFEIVNSGQQAVNGLGVDVTGINTGGTQITPIGGATVSGLTVPGNGKIVVTKKFTAGYNGDMAANVQAIFTFAVTTSTNGSSAQDPNIINVAVAGVSGDKNLTITAQ